MDCKKSERDDGMKKWLLLLTLTVLITTLLIGCGSKDEDEVVGDLSENVQTLQGYTAKANLVLHTGKEPHEYELETWFKEPEFYRISLTSKERNMTQIILKNEEGVFVLTPHLNKSFRFQSGWPENQSQVYLYESLINDILSDDKRQFSVEGNEYVFETEANYQNRTLTRQKISLTDDLKPSKVEVMDADRNVMVEVAFTEVNFNPSFEDDAFDMHSNMQGAIKDSLPTMAENEQEASGSIGSYVPEYLPDNVELVEEEEVSQDDRTMVVQRYAGDYHFTLIQERAQSQMVYMPDGQPADLGFTIGAQGENSLTWTYDGIDFRLASEDLPEEEMQAIAQSVVGQASK